MKFNTAVGEVYLKEAIAYMWKEVEKELNDFNMKMINVLKDKVAKLLPSHPIKDPFLGRIGYSYVNGHINIDHYDNLRYKLK